MKAARVLSLIFWLASPSLAEDRAVFTTTDFATGSLSVLDLQSGQASKDLLDIHGDAVVRVYGDKVYIVNRLGQDNIIVLAAADLSAPLTQFSTGNGTNPHDIAVVSDQKAYVSRYNVPSILIVNPTTGDSLGSIDLSDLADSDGLPESSQLTVSGSRLFAACQRIDQNAGFQPTEFSTIAVVDLTTDTLVDVDGTQAGFQGIQLQSKNPFDAVRKGTQWILACPGTFGDLTDGAVEVVDLSTLTSSIGLDEATAGGNITTIAPISTQSGYIVVADANFANSIKRYDLASGSVSDGLTGHSGGYIPSLRVLGDRLYVADNDFLAPGVIIYDILTGDAVDGPISTGLPPSSIAFIRETADADFDGSGQVDFLDFVSFASGFGVTLGETGYQTAYDLNLDGAVEFADFILFAASFGS